MEDPKNNGWVKIHRKMLEWEWWTDVNTAHFFTFCLLRANHSDGRWRGEAVPRGSFISSYQKMATATGLSVRQVRTALEHLKSTGELTSKTTNKNQLITICNYANYQVIESQERQTNRQATDKQTTNEKADKRQANDNKQEEKEIILFDDDDTRVSNFFEKIKIEELHKTLRHIYNEETETTNAIRQKIYREQNKLLEVTTISKYFDEFAQKTKAEGTTEMTRKDYQRNFANWIYKRIEKENQQRKINKNKNNNGQHDTINRDPARFVDRG